MNDACRPAFFARRLPAEMPACLLPIISQSWLTCIAPTQSGEQSDVARICYCKLSWLRSLCRIQDSPLAASFSFSPDLCQFP